MNSLLQAVGALFVGAFVACTAAAEPARPARDSPIMVTALPTPHSKAVTGAARIKERGLIATVAMDGHLKVWEETSGLLMSEFKPANGLPLLSLAADPSAPGRVALASSHDASGYGDATIRIMDLDGNRTLAQFPGTGGRLRYSPQGRWLISSEASLLTVWEAGRGQVYVALQVDGAGAAFADENTLLYRRHGEIVFLNLLSGSYRTVNTGGTGSFALSADGKILADVHQHDIRLWRSDNGERIATRGMMSHATFIYFAQDGSLVVGDHLNSIFKGSARNLIYRLKAGDWTLETLTAGQSPVTLVADGGDTILLGQRSGRIQRLALTKHFRRPSLGVDADDITAVAFSSDGRYLAAGYSGGGAAVWEPTSNWYRVLDPHNTVRSPPEPSFSEADTKSEHYTTTFVTGEGQTNSGFYREGVLGLAFIGPESVLLVHRSGKAEVLNVTTGKTQKSFVVADPGVVIAGSEARVAILGRTSVTFVDALTYAARRVDVPNLMPLRATLNPAGDRLLIEGFQATVELDAVQGKELSRKEPQAGFATFDQEGGRMRLAWNTPPGAAIPAGQVEDRPLAVGWSSLASGKIGILARQAGAARIWLLKAGAYAPADLNIGGTINDMAISPDGGTVAFASDHGRIALHRTQDGAALADLLSYDRRGWLVRGPNGQFDGSYAAWRNVRGTSSHARLAPVDPAMLFTGAFHPQLLTEVMRGFLEPVTVPIRALRKPPVVAITLPVSNYRHTESLPVSSKIAHSYEKRRDEKGELLSWTTLAPSAESSTVIAQQEMQTASIVLKADVSDGGDGVAECRVFRNRRLLKAMVPKLGADGRAKIEATLPLLNGDNDLSVYCFSNAGVRSNEAEVRLKGAPGLKQARNAYVLVVGIDEYGHDDVNLRYAVRDAALAEKRLRASLNATGMYAKVRIASLTNGDATADRILRGLKILSGMEPADAEGHLSALRRSEPADAVFVYFAGHGGGFAGDYRLFASGSEVGNTKTQGTLSASEIRDALETLQADRTVLIIDACESGQAMDQVDARAGPLAGRSLAQLAYDKAIFIISASQSQQAARELERLGHGVFSYTLFEQGLTGAADENLDGFVSVREWLLFAQRETPKELDAGRVALDIAQGKPPKLRSNRSSFADDALNFGQTPRVFIPDQVLAREFIMTTTGSK